LDTGGNTTAIAATAGAAFGGIVGWAVGTFTGVDVTPIAASLAVLGSFAFGRVFPAK
jgi:outer membrane lipoprotein SlyB